MSEKMSEVYEAYDMEVQSVSRGRGAMILITDKGVRQVSPLAGTEERLAEEKEFKDKLYEVGFNNIDRCIPNDEGELITCDRYGNPYVMREYHIGRECGVTDSHELTMAAENLAMFHIKAREIFSKDDKSYIYKSPGGFARKNLEMKRARNFMSKRTVKNDFELLFMKTYDYFYQQGIMCEDKMAQTDMSSMLGRIGYCHGTYNYHSILFCDGYIATVNFERFHVGYQLVDLYQYIRKVMEKSGYNYELAIDILETYDKIIPLNSYDYELIYLLYSYPEKYWKVCNRYMNTRKSWMSPVNMEKLQKVIKQEQEKKNFLDVFSDYYGVHKVEV